MPSVGSRQSGAETAIKEGVSGVLVSQGDIHEIALAIERILSDENFKNKLGSGAIDWARQNTWQKMSIKYIKLYKKILNE